MRTIPLAALVALTALARSADETLVTAQLRDGERLKASAARTDAGQMLVLTRADGTSQAIPLRDVKELRFGKAEGQDPKNIEKVWTCLSRIRRAPFAGPEFARLLSDPRQGGLAERAVALAARFQQETDPARRMRQALNLAALRFALGDLDGCRQSLRAVKALAREAPAWDPYNESCVRLAALQLPAQPSTFDPRSFLNKVFYDEFISGILDNEQQANEKARFQALMKLAGLAPP